MLSFDPTILPIKGWRPGTSWAHTRRDGRSVGVIESGPVELIEALSYRVTLDGRAPGSFADLDPAKRPADTHDRNSVHIPQRRDPWAAAACSTYRSCRSSRFCTEGESPLDPLAPDYLETVADRLGWARPAGRTGREGGR